MALTKEGINPLMVFFNPKKAFSEAIENPSILQALLLVLIPTIVAQIGIYIFSGNIDWTMFAAGLFLSVVGWILGGIILMIVLYALLGKKRKIGIASALHGLALLEMPAIAIALVSIIVMAYVTPQGMIDGTAAAGIGSTIQTILLALLMISYLVAFFFFITVAFEAKPLKAITIMAIFIAIDLMVSILFPTLPLSLFGTLTDTIGILINAMTISTLAVSA